MDSEIQPIPIFARIIYSGDTVSLHSPLYYLLHLPLHLLSIIAAAERSPFILPLPSNGYSDRRLDLKTKFT